ncbi:MAG: glycerol-3-phosphate 1-O-acyltransferase PlsY [Lachnospiraceae bacterium]|nr:glycerol-3-phosphate 1-O-acyltransferase PlsY [Lachnospiraceae bacterium]
MIRIVCLIIGYIFGLFQTAYIYGKMHGIDIRTVGSGNAGTTNTLRVLGTKAGLIVLVGDILKTMLAILIVKLLFSQTHEDILYMLVLYTAAGAILGHNYPFYLGFKGGKGIAATAGLILSMPPCFIIVGVIVFFGTFLTTHYVSLGSLLVYLALVIQLIYCGQTGFFTEMSQPALTEMYLVSIFLMIMAYWRHRSNIKKLLTGTERKTYILKKNKVD